MDSSQPDPPQNTSTPAAAPKAEFALGGITGAQHVAVAVQNVHTGPLPSPQSLAAYQHVDPSFPARIMAMAEANAETERRTAERAQTFQLAESLLGRLLGFVFAMTAILASLYLALHNQPGVAALIGGTTVIGVVAALITGKSP